MGTDETPNPYAPPTASVEPPRTDDAPVILPARRLTRLAGSIVEGLIVGIPVAILVFAMGGFEDPDALMSNARIWSAVIAVNLAFFGLNVWLWLSRAQSIGKLIVGTRIATPDGRPAATGRILVRQVPLLFLGLASAALGGVASTLSLLDAVAILLPARRCMHDYWAGTIVVEASAANDPATVERA